MFHYYKIMVWKNICNSWGRWALYLGKMIFCTKFTIKLRLEKTFLTTFLTKDLCFVQMILFQGHNSLSGQTQLQVTTFRSKVYEDDTFYVYHPDSPILGERTLTQGILVLPFWQDLQPNYNNAPSLCAWYSEVT